MMKNLSLALPPPSLKYRTTIGGRCIVCTQEHDRRLAEKAAEREAMAEAKRSKMLEAADRARLARERLGLERQKWAEMDAAVKRTRQEEATRCVQRC